MNALLGIIFQCPWRRRLGKLVHAIQLGEKMAMGSLLDYRRTFLVVYHAITCCIVDDS